MDIHQYIDFLKARPEQASKEDLKKIYSAIDDLRKEQANHLVDSKKLTEEITQSILDTLKIVGRLRTTVRTCRVFLKPSTKAFVSVTLPEAYEVTVLQSNHKWVYVDFISPEDNLQETGWIQKKYLQRMN